MTSAAAAAGRLVRNGWTGIRVGSRATGSAGELSFRIAQSPHEAIATTEGRPQRFPIGPERLAHRGYVNLERIFLDDHARPYTSHELVFGDEFARRLNQNRKIANAGPREQSLHASQFTRRDLLHRRSYTRCGLLRMRIYYFRVCKPATRGYKSKGLTIFFCRCPQTSWSMPKENVDARPRSWIICRLEYFHVPYGFAMPILNVK